MRAKYDAVIVPGLEVVTVIDIGSRKSQEAGKSGIETGKLRQTALSRSRVVIPWC